MSDGGALLRLLLVTASSIGLILFAAFVVSRLLRTRTRGMSIRMQVFLALALIVGAASTNVFPFSQQPAPVNTDMHYQIGPDSLPREGVPKGEVRGPFTLTSTAYPGTQHTYWVYVPAQYDAAVPASLMIFNDGQAFNGT